MIFKNEETNIQAMAINYLRLTYSDALFTIAPNGMKLQPWVAAMLKAMGYTPGTPDLIVFEPRGIYHGLFIEIKTEKGQLAPHQRVFLEALDKRGYKTYVCYGYKAVVEALNNYLGGK